jgi:hypothetical protein
MGQTYYYGLTRHNERHYFSRLYGLRELEEARRQ